MAKTTVEGYRTIDIRYLERKGFLVPGTTNLYWEEDGKRIGAITMETQLNRVVLRYKAQEPGGNWVPIEDPISLGQTNSAFGRERLWFLCPGCGRRVVILYGGKYFRCRLCLGLVYGSQQVSPRDRALRRTQRNRMKLGGSPSLFSSFPPRPRYMRWLEYLPMAIADDKVLSQLLKENGIPFAMDDLEAKKEGRKSVRPTK